jgi:hypothetical protein
MPGKFGSTGVAPVDGNMTDYPYAWVTVGGAGTSSGAWEKTAESDILAAGAKGCAFDEEGGVSADVARDWIKSMRTKHPDWTFVYIPQCGTGILDYGLADGGCDFIAPMMYYSNGDSYPNMDFTTGGGNVCDCLDKIQQNGWPAAKTILTFQSFDAYRLGNRGNTSGNVQDVQNQTVGHVLGAGCTGCEKGDSEGDGLLKTLGKLLHDDYSVTLNYWGAKNVTLQGPYAGVLGWPAQCGGAGHKCWPSMDQHNLNTVLNAAGMPTSGGD